MKHLILAGLACVLLAGCKPTEDEQRALQDALPPGCTARDVGEYGDVNDLVVVTCPKASTKTSVAYTIRLYGKVWISRLGETITITGDE